MARKLYINIDEVRIHGDAGELTAIVTQVDKDLESLANETAELAQVIRRNFETNKGDQYAKVGEVADVFSKKLIEQSIEVNDLQHQIVQYQNKIYKYEEQHRTGIENRKHQIKEVKENLSTNDTFLTHETIMATYNKLVAYSNSTKATMKKMKSQVVEIGRIWYDKQYKNFSQFMDELIDLVNKALKVFDLYAEHLKKQVVEIRG